MKRLGVLLALVSAASIGHGGHAAYGAPLVCRAPEGQRAQVDALRQKYLDDPIYAFARRISGEPVRCEGERGRGELNARLRITFADGSTFEAAQMPPEAGHRVYRSTKPIADVAAVMKLLHAQLPDADFRHHDDQTTEPGVVKQRFFVPDTNLQVFVFYRGRELVGFGDSFAM